MSSKLQLDVRHFNRWWRHLDNAYEVKAGVVFVAGKTVWSMPERFKVVCIPRKTLYKCSAIYLSGIPAGSFDLARPGVAPPLQVGRINGGNKSGRGTAAVVIRWSLPHFLSLQTYLLQLALFGVLHKITSLMGSIEKQDRTSHISMFSRPSFPFPLTVLTRVCQLPYARYYRVPHYRVIL